MGFFIACSDDSCKGNRHRVNLYGGDGVTMSRRDGLAMSKCDEIKGKKHYSKY